ncbi:MAG: hypothetical protein OXI16_13120 [Chloroflexota bacterium]|nr:hypothetical protein [Chloroflexota bacterium]
MSTTIGEKTCPIWGVNCDVSQPYEDKDIYLVENSFRAGGDYEITFDARVAFRNEFYTEKTKLGLTSILVERWMKGIDVPRLTEDDVLHAQEKRRLPVHERAERLLRLLASRSLRAGDILEIVPYTMFLSFAEQLSASGVPVGTNFDLNPEFYLCPSALAWSESTTDEELDFLTDYLMGQSCIIKGGTITSNAGAAYAYASHGYLCRVEVPGYSRIEGLVTNADPLQCFVAMWFDPSMEDVYEQGIRPAIEAIGYSPLRIDRQNFIGKIDDEIIAQIRRSRFIVADFTHRIPDIRDGKCHDAGKDHGKLGARGGVYYEAGFAHGLGLPVIFTCRDDMFDSLHFDTRQFNHIAWKTPEDLREKLANRIGSVIGDVPNRTG